MGGTPTVVAKGSSPVHVEKERQPYTSEQLCLIRTTSEARISPDGLTVAFVSDISGAMELWTVPATGGWPVQLTALDEQVTEIEWSPDSRRLVFTSDYGGNERAHIYKVAAGGGPAIRVTDHSFSEAQPRFSPDGKRLAFIADPDPDREFLFQLHVVDMETQESRQLTWEPVNVQFPTWSPDNKTIAINRSGDDRQGDLLLINADSGATVVVEPPVADGIYWPDSFSPDGRYLTTLCRNAQGFHQLAVLEFAEPAGAGQPPAPLGKPVFLGPEDWDVNEARWGKDGIFFIITKAGNNKLGFVRLESPQSITWVLDEGIQRHLSLDHSGTRWCVLREDINYPADAWVYELLPGQTASPHPNPPPQGGRGRQVTASLMGGVDSQELQSGEWFYYPSFDGIEIHSLLLKPRRFLLGNPSPAVVYAHGGPSSMIDRSFFPFFQVLAEAGIAVIAPNFRGSIGYGLAFEDLNNQDWGGGDLKDLVAGVEYFARRGDIDASRVAIAGGSYGGFLTLLALGKYPKVWKAGVESYGMPDLTTDYLIAKSRFCDWYETKMGTPKTHPQLFYERSPQRYVDDIEAPLMIFQGANDTNVPQAESDLLVALLQELKKPHEYVVYEDEGHVFTQRKNRLDYCRQALKFFLRHLS